GLPAELVQREVVLAPRAQGGDRLRERVGQLEETVGADDGGALASGMDVLPRQGDVLAHRGVTSAGPQGASASGRLVTETSARPGQHQRENRRRRGLGGPSRYCFSGTRGKAPSIPTARVCSHPLHHASPCVWPRASCRGRFIRSVGECKKKT